MKVIDVDAEVLSVFISDVGKGAEKIYGKVTGVTVKTLCERTLGFRRCIGGGDCHGQVGVD